MFGVLLGEAGKYVGLVGLAMKSAWGVGRPLADCLTRSACREVEGSPAGTLTEGISLLFLSSRRKTSLEPFGDLGNR